MDLKKKTFRFLVSALAVLILLYSFALVNKLFFFIWWYDIPLHFLGGFCVAILAVYVYYFSGRFKTVVSDRQIFLTALVAAIVIGTLWEFFEYFAGLTFNIGSYALDTTKDMFMDIFGGIVAYVYYSRHYNELPHE